MTVAEAPVTATTGGQTIRPAAGSRVKLDASAAPHVQGRVVVAMTDALMLLTDPRQSPAPRVQITAGGRSFDLMVSSRDVAHQGAELELTVESDEGLMIGYAPLADDWAPLTRASSLRAVVDYALAKASPGASLAAAPSVDADMTPYWQVSNLMPNPAVRSVVGNWIAGGANGTLSREAGHAPGSIPAGADVTTATLTTWTGNSGLGQGGAFPQTAAVAPYVPVSPFKPYTISAFVYLSAAKQLRLMTQVFGSDGALLSGGIEVPFAVYNAAGAQIAAPAMVQNVAGGAWVRLVGSFTTPENAARLGPFIYPSSTAQWTAGQTLRTTAWMVHEGIYPTPLPYFDGATPTDVHYTYTASGAAHASAAVRTPIADAADPESLLWRAGQTALDFVHPLVQAKGLRLVCDERRVWTLRPDGYSAAGSLAIRAGVNMIDGTERIARDSGLWFDACVIRYRWTDRAGVQQERIDAYALTPAYTTLRLIELTVPYPGPGRAAYAVQRAQGVGREVTAQSMADWSSSAEQPVQITLPSTPLQVGLTTAIDFDLHENTMTVAARTTDVGAHSINALTGTINALTGTINAL